MMVKTANGTDFNASGRGTTALGIIGTALGGLAVANQSGLGLFNGGQKSPCVTEEKFYETEISNLKEGFNTTMGLSDRLCSIEQRLAVDETSIAKNFEFMDAQNKWQNKFFEAEFKYADLLEQCRINDATCKCIKGDVYASPSQLADPYMGGMNVIATRHAYPTYCTGFGYNDCGCDCGYGYNGYGY